MLPRKTPCRLTVPRYIYRWKCFAHAISRPRTVDSFAAFPWLTEFSGIFCPVNQPNQYLDVSQAFKVPHQSGRKRRECITPISTLGATGHQCAGPHTSWYQRLATIKPHAQTD